MSQFAPRKTPLADDLFGHAPFAERMAASIRGYHAHNHAGRVIALYAPWGAGKSMALDCVEYYLTQPSDSTYLVMRFSPWVFAGHEHLAQAFLDQLRATISADKRFTAVQQLLVEFADSMSDIEMPGLWGLGMFVVQMMTRKWRTPTDVTLLKKLIASQLIATKCQIVVLIDDMNRLAPDEVRQMLGVIQAMADFPNMVFLLALDHEFVQTIATRHPQDNTHQLLGKIVDVAFDLPGVDRVALENALTTRLAAIILPYDNQSFDTAYWIVVFTQVVRLMHQPRDVVRFCDTLAITYASQYMRVHAIDFVAVEALRLFVPRLYDWLRLHPEYCVSTEGSDVPTADFLATCLAFVPDNQRAGVRMLLRTLFPALAMRLLPAVALQKMAQAKRVCASPELFARYFRYDVAQGDQRRSDIMALVRTVTTVDQLRTRLRAMTKSSQEFHKRIPAIIERLHDHVESDIAIAQVPMYVQVLLDIGDELVAPQLPPPLAVTDDWRIARLVVRLVCRLPLADRDELLHTAFAYGAASGIQARFAKLCGDALDDDPDNDDGVIVTAPLLRSLKQLWLQRVARTGISAHIAHASLARVVMESHRQWRRELEV